jgi:hypothetical protein
VRRLVRGRGDAWRQGRARSEQLGV